MTCFRLIEAEKTQHPVSLLCQVLGVSRAGYYAWKTRPASQRQVRDRELLTQIRAIHTESKGTYGWPRCMPSCATGGSERAASGWPG